MTSSRAARSRGAPTTRRRSRRAERVPKVNDVVDIWWANDKTFYRGRLTNKRHTPTAFRILYDDGETEDLDLVNEHWKFAHDDKPPTAESDQIINLVLEPESTSKKPKPKPSKASTARPDPHETSDDERDKDYVEEQERAEQPSKPKRARADSDKPKKRPKKARKQSATSDKTSSASRPPPKTNSESRHNAQRLSDQPDSTSHLTSLDQVPTGQTKQPAPDATSTPQKSAALLPTDSKHASISNDLTNVLQKSKNDIQIAGATPSPATAPNIRTTFLIETPHIAKSQNSPKPVKTKTATAEGAQPRTNGNSVSQLPTPAPSTGSQRLTDTVATSQQVTTVQHAHIVTQRDLATIQAEPSLIPADRPSLPSSSDATASVRHPLISSDAATSFVPYKQAAPGPLPTTSASTPSGLVKKKSVGGEMGDNFPADEGPSPASVPVKVAIRPRAGERNLSGSGVSNPSRTHGEVSTDNSGLAVDINSIAEHQDVALRKRLRDGGDLVDSVTEAPVNGDLRPKRPRTAETVEGAGASAPPDNPLTHFPEHDTTFATLVNRRLNPIEKHISSLSDDMRAITKNVEAQRNVSEALTGTLKRLEQDIRKEIRAIQEEWRSVQADRHEKQQEMVKLLREVKEGLARVSASQPEAHAVEIGPVIRSSAPNGYNMRSPEYHRTAATPVTVTGIPQVAERRDPPQAVMPARGPISRGHVEMPGTANSDDDVNVSPRRVAAPMPHPSRSPGDSNQSKVNQLPHGPKFRIISVVARQITVWLLETPHEFDPTEGVSLDLWARRTSAGALERVADRLGHFDSYSQAYQTLSTSLGNDAVEMSWFISPEDRSNVMRARRNYAAWDPPPTDSEWQSECVLLTEIANGFHRALENHIWRNEDDLTAAVVITKNAAAWYGLGQAAGTAEPNSGNHVAMSQSHRTNHDAHHNGTQFIRTSR